MSRSFTTAVLATTLALLMAIPSVANAANAASKPTTGTLTGKITGFDGKPVASASVQLITAKDAAAMKKAMANGEKPDMPTPVAQGSTDADGKYSLADVPPGGYVLMARLKGVGSGRVSVVVRAGVDTTQNLALRASKKKAPAPDSAAPQ